MICPPCREAGKALSGGDPASASHFHLFCIQNRATPDDPRIIGHVEPTLCDCQHKTDQSYIRQEAK